MVAKRISRCAAAHGRARQQNRDAAIAHHGGRPDRQRRGEPQPDQMEIRHAGRSARFPLQDEGRPEGRYADADGAIPRSNPPRQGALRCPCVIRVIHHHGIRHHRTSFLSPDYQGTKVAVTPVSHCRSFMICPVTMNITNARCR